MPGSIVPSPCISEYGDGTIFEVHSSSINGYVKINPLPEGHDWKDDYNDDWLGLMVGEDRMFAAICTKCGVKARISKLNFVLTAPEDYVFHIDWYKNSKDMGYWNTLWNYYIPIRTANEEGTHRYQGTAYTVVRSASQIQCEMIRMDEALE